MFDSAVCVALLFAGSTVALIALSNFIAGSAVLLPWPNHSFRPLSP